MSVLSATSGTPERVFALLKLLDALGAPSDRSTIESLMTSKVDREAGEENRTSIQQTLAAARGLNLISEAEGKVGLGQSPGPSSYLSFADLVHERLVSKDVGDGNSVVLEAFAYVAHRSDAEGGPHWFMEMAGERLAEALRDFIDAQREESGKGTFNTTRTSHWQKWTDLLGLTVSFGRGRSFPDITSRLWREIAAGEASPTNVDVPAREFLSRVLHRMPYLPGGARSVELLGPATTEGVSELLSAALRDLEDDGRLRLVVIGDAGGAIKLADDEVRPAKSFNSVTIVRNGSQS